MLCTCNSGSHPGNVWPNMHGGFCLYNGGFTAAVICVLLVPVLEKFVKTKEERKSPHL